MGMNTEGRFRILERKSEVAMLLSGVCILASVCVVWLSGSFSFWIFAKFFYALGVVLILLDR